MSRQASAGRPALRLIVVAIVAAGVAMAAMSVAGSAPSLAAANSAYAKLRVATTSMPLARCASGPLARSQ